jgi:hypothetical protein
MYYLPASFGAAALLRKRRRAPILRKELDLDFTRTITELEDLARANGYTGLSTDYQGMADYLWSVSPTDDVGALLEELAAQGLIRTPW